MSIQGMSPEFHQAQIAKIYEDIEKSRFEREKLRAETTKIGAETLKINKESKYYVLALLLSSVVIGALIALGSAILTKLFL